jgi:hypothetical protein
VNTFKKEQGQARVSDKHEEADCHADTPGSFLSVFQVGHTEKQRRPASKRLLEERDTPESGYEMQPSRSGLLIACACVGDRDLWKPPALIGYNGENSRRKVQDFMTDSCGGP